MAFSLEKIALTKRVNKNGSSEFHMGKSQTMVKNVVQEYFFMAIFK